GLYRAMKLNDPFEQVAAAGLFVLVGQQAFINVAVRCNMSPPKCMTLRFIIYGASSMLAMGLTLGMALALTRRRPGAYEPGEGLAKTDAFAPRHAEAHRRSGRGHRRSPLSRPGPGGSADRPRVGRGARQRRARGGLCGRVSG